MESDEIQEAKNCMVQRLREISKLYYNKLAGDSSQNNLDFLQGEISAYRYSLNLFGVSLMESYNIMEEEEIIYEKQ